jgi:hypothetical protein
MHEILIAGILAATIAAWLTASRSAPATVRLDLPSRSGGR